MRSFMRYDNVNFRTLLGALHVALLITLCCIIL